jgi:hypothetical protein
MKSIPRRSVLKAGIALSALGTSGVSLANDKLPKLDVIPAPPSKPTPGKLGDFNFLTGEWHIQQWRYKSDSKSWDAFEGNASVWHILAGLISIEELRIPARDFSGMGLRSLDLESKIWSDFWVNAKSGVFGAAGLTGSFEDGDGLFYADYPDGDKTIKGASIWDRITKNSCRWRQAASKDGGKSWDQTWIMHWTRVR